MQTAAQVLIAIIALLHVWFCILEMFLWDRPAGLRAFGHSPEQAAASRVLAANQGLYNAFLAAGLLLGLYWADQRMQLLFLCFVLVAGLYGAWSASRKILFVQALPAAIALALILLS